MIKNFLFVLFLSSVSFSFAETCAGRPQKDCINEAFNLWESGQTDKARILFSELCSQGRTDMCDYATAKVEKLKVITPAKSSANPFPARREDTKFSPPTTVTPSQSPTYYNKDCTGLSMDECFNEKYKKENGFDLVPTGFNTEKNSKAIASELNPEVCNKLETNVRNIRHPYRGVGSAKFLADDINTYLVAVKPGTLWDDLGLQRGDRIVTVRYDSGPGNLMSLQSGSRPWNQMEVWRDGKTYIIKNSCGN